MTPTPQPPPLATLHQIDEICDRYEQSCLAGEPANLSDLAAGWEEPERSALVTELVAIDLHYATLLNEGRRRSDYLALLPGDGAAIDEALRQAGEVTDESTQAHFGADADSTVPPNATARDASAATLANVGRYRIERPLGAGAFGVVYLAHDPELNRHVAIKCPRANMWKSQAQWDMFRREAELAAKLRHPGVVAIHDVGRDETGQPYFVMEYVRGESLKERLARGPLEPQNAVSIAVALAEALDNIHAAGLVHRDLKPANVLLDESGQPHIADLGLALDAHGAFAPEQAGTVAYMAPEQTFAHDADATTADQRCDTWALGVILYEMLAGRRPFQGATRAELIRKIRDEPPLATPAWDAGVHPAVAHACMKCLAKNPRERFASAGAAGRALAATQLELRPAWSRRRVAALALSFVAAMTGVGALWSISAPPSRPGANDGSPQSEVAAPRPQPFVIHGSGQRFADLNDAVEAAADGAVVEVDADGLISINPVAVGRRNVTIRAARGRQPVIALADESHHSLILTDGALALDGLDLRRGAARARSPIDAPCIIQVDAPGSLIVKNCRLVMESQARMRSHCILASGDCRIENSELIHQHGGGVMWYPPEGAKLIFDNCAVGVVNLAILNCNLNPAATAEIRRSTVIAELAFIVKGRVPARTDGKLLIRAEECYFNVDAMLLRVVPPGGRALQAIDALTKALAWEETRNAYAVRETFILGAFGERRRESLDINDLASWNEVWGIAGGSIVVPAGGSAIATGAFDVSIPIKDRFQAKAPLDQLPGSFIAGAHLDAVGPEAKLAVR